MRITHAKVWQIDGSFAERDLCIGPDGRFAVESGGEVLDAAGLYAIPGLVDVHFHGCAGHDFCEGTETAIQAIADYQAGVGVLSICPATMTYPEEVLGRIADAAAAHKNTRGADLVGIHMEGPFLSPAKIGAQNPAYLQQPDAAMFRRLQQRAGGLFRICDVAPEQPGGLALIDALKGEVHLSLAHTNADYETARQAFARGADHLTHTYNAMPGIHHRSPGPIPAAAEAGAFVEVICDGAHIHPAAVRLLFRLCGVDRLVLVSDSMEAAGLPDGSYALGGQQVIKRGRRATLAASADTLAGSVTNLYDCMCIAVQKMGLPLGAAVRAASYNPACSIGVQADCGSLETGCWGNVLLVNDKLELVHILRRGCRIK